MRKLRVLTHSNHHLLKTGLGRHHKNLLSYLHSTGKYELVEAANGLVFGKEDAGACPWRVMGTLPDRDKEPHLFEGDEPHQKAVAYGHAKIGDIVKEFKPDVYIGMEDIWGLSGLTNHWWWNKPHCVVWTTLDSLPIHKDAIALAPKIKNYLTWSSFASKELNKLGIRADYQFGSVDDKNFFPLSQDQKLKLRERFGIRADDFIVGFVFRNQPRKSVPNLMAGFSLFKQKNKNAKLLLHTNWAEGWDIKRIAAENGVSLADILTTHVCSACGHIIVEQFSVNERDCPACGYKKSLRTPSIRAGLTEEQMNLVYNLMDVYCHPFNSGGQEIPIQEAKLAGLVTLVTSYSCGVDSMVGGFPLDWTEYREGGSNFIKAFTKPESIFKRLEECVVLKEKGILDAIGNTGREYVLANYSPKEVGSSIENLIDRLGPAEYSVSSYITVDESMAPAAQSPEDLIEKIATECQRGGITVSQQDAQNAVGLLKAGVHEPIVTNIFRRVAKKHNAQNPDVEIDSFLREGDTNRCAIVVPDSLELCLGIRMFIPRFKKEKRFDIYIIGSSKMRDVFSEDQNVAGLIPDNRRYLNYDYLKSHGFSKVLMLNRENFNIERAAFA